MTQNHTLNARLHKLPACPECGAAPSTPCADERGRLREPHNVRQKMADGELVVRPKKKKAPTAKRVADVRKTLMRAVDNAVDDVRRFWGISNKATRK